MSDPVASEHSAPAPEPVAPAGGEAPQSPPTPDAPESAPAVDHEATIAQLRAELEAAAPILSAHREAEEKNKTELEREREARAELESQLSAAKRSQLHATVAEKTGLPSAVVASFAGETEADLVAAVEAAKAAVAQSSAPPPANLNSRPKPTVGGGGTTGGGDAEDGPKELAEKVRKAMGY